MIKIVDYGLGNISAFLNLYQRLHIEAQTAKSADELRNATKLILPGVGAFDHAVRKLNNSGMREVLDELVCDRKVPVLGVCVGMQVMAKRSEEGVLEGLGWIDGEVRKFDKERSGAKLLLPHMGWNDVRPYRTDLLFQGLDNDTRFYFLHSYYFQAFNDHEVLSVTEYSCPFASAVHSGNIFGVQFHPEKSHQWGIQLLRNFAENC